MMKMQMIIDPGQQLLKLLPVLVKGLLEVVVFAFFSSFFSAQITVQEYPRITLHENACLYDKGQPASYSSEQIYITEGTKVYNLPGDYVQNLTYLFTKSCRQDLAVPVPISENVIPFSVLKAKKTAAKNKKIRKKITAGTNGKASFTKFNAPIIVIIQKQNSNKVLFSTGAKGNRNFFTSFLPAHFYFYDQVPDSLERNIYKTRPPPASPFLSQVTLF